MSAVNVTIDIDKGLKETSEKMFGELGFSLSSVINAFLRQVIRERKVSFNLEEPELSGWALTEKALEEAEQGIGIHGPFDSFEEMMEDINAEA